MAGGGYDKKNDRDNSPAPAPAQNNKEGRPNEEIRIRQTTAPSEWQIPANIVRLLHRPQQHDRSGARNERPTGGLVDEGGGRLQVAGLTRTPYRSALQVTARCTKSHLSATRGAGFVVFVVYRIFFFSIKTRAGLIYVRQLVMS